MSKRITISISSQANKKTRIFHAELVSELPYSVSYSKMAEILMMEGLKNINKKNLIKELLLKKNK